MELKAKIVIKAKGESATLPATVKEARCALKWTSSVDLDLMAFGEKKDGTKFSVFTKNLGGSHGDLNQSPYVSLSGDAGVGAEGGDNEEVLTMAKFDDIKYMDLVALNYTAAKENKPEAFNKYDGGLDIQTNDPEQSFGLKLDSSEEGVANYIARFEAGVSGLKIIKKDTVLRDLPALVAAIPGASALTSGGQQQSQG